jgi:hypothetical protein
MRSRSNTNNQIATTSNKTDFNATANFTVYVNIMSVNLLDSDWLKTVPIKHSLA